MVLLNIPQSTFGKGQSQRKMSRPMYSILLTVCGELIASLHRSPILWPETHLVLISQVEASDLEGEEWPSLHRWACRPRIANYRLPILRRGETPPRRGVEPFRF